MEMWQLTAEERADRERMILQNLQNQAMAQQAHQAMQGMQQKALGELSRALAKNSDVTAAELEIANQVPHGKSGKSKREGMIGNECRVLRRAPSPDVAYALTLDLINTMEYLITDIMEYHRIHKLPTIEGNYAHRNAREAVAAAKKAWGF